MSLFDSELCIFLQMKNLKVSITKHILAKKERIYLKELKFIKCVVIFERPNCQLYLQFITRLQ